MNSLPAPRVLVLKADGTNCEVETGHAVSLAGGRPEIVPVSLLRRGDERLADYDVLILPGGFSYGDDVSSGKILAVELVTFLGEELARFVEAGKPILGICNGFQVLVRTGLLPFRELGRITATLAHNRSGHFECRWVRMATNPNLDATAALPDVIELPVAHGEGCFMADAESLRLLEAEGLVALRYVDASGSPTGDHPANPNGSLNAIAGIVDPTGRIFGLMPHPERFVESFHHPAHRARAGRDPDGLALMRAVLALA